MKAKQLIVLAVVALALGIGGLKVLNNRRQDFQHSTEGLGANLLGAFDVNAVQGLRIAHGTNQLNVVKSGDAWIVKERGDYPANFGDVADLVRKLADLKVAQPVEVGASRLPMLELTKDTATQLDLLDAKGQPLKSLLLGKQHTKGGGEESASPFGRGGGGFPDGRYVQLGAAGGSGKVALVAEPLANAAPKPEEWLSKDFFKIEQPVAITIKHAEGTNSFALTRTNELADWKLEAPAAGEELDKNKLFSFNNILNNPSFTDVVVAPDAAKLGLDHPDEAEIRTATGFTYKIKLGKADGESYPMQVSVDASLVRTRTAGADEKPEDKTKLDKEFADKLAKQEEKLKAEQSTAKWTYTVNKWTIDALLKKRSELLVEKKADAGKKPDAAAAPAGDDPLKVDLPGAK